MTCEEALALLSGHLDGENTQEEEQALLAHLEVCDECCALLSAFEEADAGVLALEAEPPQGLREQIMETVRRESVRPKKRVKPWAVPTVAAAAVVAILLGTGILSQPQLQFTADSAANTTASLARAETTMDTAAPYAAADTASEAPALEKEMLEPEMAMASDEAPASEETDAVVQPDTTTETTTESVELPVDAVDSTSVAQEIAQTRQARVIVLSAMEPGLAEDTQEYLEDGSVLVTLKDAAAWEQLQTAYPDAPVFEPATGQAEQYFALVLEP